MDFFASQDHARKQTKWLVVYFIFAVIGMVGGIYCVLAMIFLGLDSQGVIEEQFSFFNLPLLLAVIVGVVFVICIGSWYKMFELRGGGSAVANSLGARRLQPNSVDPVERRILNVVEEMALASGTAVPPVYVLDEETSINAFAAGHSIDDAVIGVNRGTIEQLNRDELQGVIAHEFSHILNGDMRMSLRMIGVLHGIQLLALIGYFILRGAAFRSGRDNKGAGAILAIALTLLVFGSVGLFFARLIKASVSRQREYLADASAVQFTRNPEGISGALKMIGGSHTAGALKTANAEVASHMFFANMFKSRWIGWLATHPPLEQRIGKLDPQFNGDYSHYMATRKTASIVKEKKKSPKKNEARRGNFPGFGGVFTPGGAAEAFPIDPLVVVAGVGLPDENDVEYSHALVERIPSFVAEAARDLFSARCLVFATLIKNDPEIAKRQVSIIQEDENDATLLEVSNLLPHMRALDAAFRLPVFEIVQGTLVGMSPQQYETFRKTINDLILADGQVSMFEFFMQHHLLVHLDRHFGIKPDSPAKFKSILVLQEDVSLILGILVRAGHDDVAVAEQAFQAAMDSLGHKVWGSSNAFNQLNMTHENLANSLNRLSAATPKIKKSILLAAAEAITFDGKVTVEEAELFRAISESLDCPVPPVVSSEIKSMQEFPA